jgi:mannose-6-phosphate isomerase-like protein (cupin superfamily)
MNILAHSSIPIFSLPGIEHQTIAQRSRGTQQVESWKQSLAPGAATPPHFHKCEEVVYVLAGNGEIAIEGKAIPFAADCTLILPAGQVHQITNTGSETLRLAAWLSESPARVFSPSGERLTLPWES